MNDNVDRVMIMTGILIGMLVSVVIFVFSVKTTIKVSKYNKDEMSKKINEYYTYGVKEITLYVYDNKITRIKPKNKDYKELVIR